MIGLLFFKKGVGTREREESPAIHPHWSEVERVLPPHYNEWINFIKDQLKKSYSESLPPKISKKYKRKFVSVAKNL